MNKEKETKNVVEETVDKVVDAVKDNAEKVVDTGKEAAEAVKDKVEEVVKTVNVPAVSKKSTWWNRIWSAIVGAILAFAATFGITNEHVEEQKDRTEKIKVSVREAIDDIKSGKLTEATTKLESAIATTKEVVSESKKVIDNIKNKDSKEPEKKEEKSVEKAKK